MFMELLFLIRGGQLDYQEDWRAEFGGSAQLRSAFWAT